MTAIEWLIKEHFGNIENCTPNFRKHIEQAKEMEEQQQDEFAMAFAEWRLTTLIKKADEYAMRELLEIFKNK